MIGLILNIITLIIVGLFIYFIYVAYRQRPDITIKPIDVMRDIVGGQAAHSRIYSVVPTKRLLYGPIGDFGNYSDVDYSRLEGNMYQYNEGTKPWEGEDNANFGSYTGVTRDELANIQGSYTQRRRQYYIEMKNNLISKLSNDVDKDKVKALDVDSEYFLQNFENVREEVDVSYDPEQNEMLKRLEITNNLENSLTDPTRLRALENLRPQDPKFYEKIVKIQNM